MVYKASFKNNSDLNMDLVFKGKKCILLISVGQSYHENAKLSATINLINKSEFSSCSVVVADSLQKYNLIYDATPYETSMFLGDDWLRRNKIILDNFTIPNQIFRWDFWLKYNKYSKYRNMLESEYSSNPVYQKSIDETINQFMSRYITRNPETSDTIKKILFNNCLQYLLEECAIIICIWAVEGYDFIVYPKPITSALRMTYEIFVRTNYPNKVEWLSLIFKKSNSPDLLPLFNTK